MYHVCTRVSVHTVHTMTLSFQFIKEHVFLITYNMDMGVSVSAISSVSVDNLPSPALYFYPSLSPLYCNQAHKITHGIDMYLESVLI